MFKNVAGQKLTVFAFDSTTNLPKTGDAANITAYVDKDDAGVTVLADTSATEKDSTNAKGYYIFDLAQGETNADKLLFSAKSATSNIVVIGVPAVVFTYPATGLLAPATAGRTVVVDAAGLVDANMVKGGPSGSGVATTANLITNLKTIYDTDYATVYDATNKAFLAKLGNFAMGGSSLALTTGAIACSMITASGAVAFQSTFVVTGAMTLTAGLTGNITGNLSGSVGSVTGAVGSVTGAVGSVIGAVGSVTGSVGSIAAGGISAASFAAGAIDAAAIAANAIGASELAADAVAEIQSGLSTLDAAGVRTAVGLASANLDTQLSTIAGYIDTEVATLIVSVGSGLNTLATAIKAKTDNLPSSPAAVGSAMTLTSGERDSIAAALLDLANGIETGKTMRQSLRLMAAALAGKRSNSGTASEQFDAIGNAGTARIVSNADAAGDGTPTLTP